MADNGTTVLGWMLRQRRGIVDPQSTAAEIGLSASTLSRIERGETPTVDNLVAVCDWLGLDVGRAVRQLLSPMPDEGGKDPAP